MIGQIIVHKEYGKGTIIRTNGDYITVKFLTGEKQFKTAELFQFSSDSKVKPIYTQDKSNTNVNKINKTSCSEESIAEAAKRKFKEKLEAERKRNEESSPAMIAAGKNESAKLASEKRKKWDAEEKEKEKEKSKVELLEYERNLALRQEEEKKYALRREKKQRESEKRDVVKREKYRQENETRIAEKREFEKIDAERKAIEKREEEKRTALLLQERKRALKETRIKIRTSQMNKYIEILERREIKYLLHFTRIDNLNSILQNGLVPVNLQSEMKMVSVHNDEYRLDEQLDCTSFSVGFPNYRLFYKFRTTNFPGTKWVILLIDANILLSSNNAIFFCQTNAASVFSKNIDSNYLCGIEAFEKMFCDTTTTKENKIINRESLNISNDCSTDPQAEILISDIIPTSYIIDVCFSNLDEMNEYIDYFGSGLVNIKNSLYSKKMFTCRADWEFWQKEKQNGETDLLCL